MDNNEMNGNSMSGTQNSSSGKKPTKLIGIIVGIVVVVAVIVCAVFAFSKNSSVFASKGKKFVKLATSDQKFLQVLKNDKGTSQVNTDLEIKFDELMKAFDYEDQDVGNLLFNSKEIKKGDDYSLNASLSMENIDDAKIELQVAKTGNLVGVNLPNITNKFLAIDTSDIDGLIENLKDLGLLDESFTNEIAEDETSEEMQKELKKLVDKYLDVLGENISDYVEKTSNVNVEIGNYSEKATEYVFTLNGKNVVEIGLLLEKELLKNKKDIEKLVELGIVNDAEEFSSILEEDIKNNEEIIKSDDFIDATEEILTIKLYEKDGKNIATILDLEDVQIGFYVFEESKNDYEFIFQIKSEDIEFAIDWTMQANGSVKEGSLSFSYDDGTNKISSKICDLKIESLTKATDDLIEVNKDNSLILNTATEDDIEDFANDVTSNVQGIMSKISSSLDY